MVAKHAAEAKDWLAVPMTEDQKRVVGSKASDAARLAVARRANAVARKSGGLVRELVSPEACRSGRSLPSLLTT